MTTFLGIDAGTTSMKAALFAEDGQILAVARREYTLSTPAPAVVECEAETYWQACCAVIREVISRSGIKAADVATVAIASQAETLVTVDATGRPIRPVIVWLDNRAADEAALFRDRFGDEAMFRISGQPEIVPTWPACKILWLKRHEPEVFARTERFLLLEDYLLYRLTGLFVTEMGLQSDSLLVDITVRNWYAPVLDFLGLSADRLGQLLEPGEAVGRVSSTGAADTGLGRATLVVSGTIDHTAGALGAGNVRPGMVSETTGGSLAVVATTDRPFFDPYRRLPCFYHARRDHYCLFPWGQTAGLALRWFRDAFYPTEVAACLAAGVEPYDVMSAEAAQAPAGCGGLTALPHLEGAFTPEYNPFARAVFAGATLRTGRGHFVRSLMESVAYMLKRQVDLVEGMGFPVDEIRSLGGGARSALWLQIKADVLGISIVTVQGEENACLGAAMLGAVAVGHYSDLDEAVGGMVRLKDRIEPDRRNAAVYADGFERYCRLYDAVAPLYDS